MTVEADRARELATHFEGWKWKITEQTGGKYRIPFDVKSEDLPESVKNAPVGTRFMIAIVEIADNEEPKEPKPKSYAQQAKLMSMEESFAEFVLSRFSVVGMTTEECIEDFCGVKSCSEIIEGTEAGRTFKSLQAEYLNWKQYGE